MTPRGIQITLIGFAALGIVGCGSSEPAAKGPAAGPKIQPATVAPGQEASLFPLAEGNQWVYQVDSTLQAAQGQKSASQEATFRIAKVQDSGGAKVATMEVYTNGKKTESSEWSVNSGGIYQNTAGTPPVKFSPPQLVVKFPVVAGESFQWSGTGKLNSGSTGASTVRSKVLGPQEVDTPMGRLSAFAISSESKWTDKKLEYSMNGTIWWAPNIGIVRYVQAVGNKNGISTIVLRLKSRSLKDR